MEENYLMKQKVIFLKFEKLELEFENRTHFKRKI